MLPWPDMGTMSTGAPCTQHTLTVSPPHSHNPPAVMRDRNVWLPWDQLRGVLDSIARINGNMTAYRAAAEQRSTVAEVAPPGPDWLWQLCYLPQRV